MHTWTQYLNVSSALLSIRTVLITVTLLRCAECVTPGCCCLPRVSCTCSEGCWTRPPPAWPLRCGSTTSVSHSLSLPRSLFPQSPTGRNVWRHVAAEVQTPRRSPALGALCVFDRRADEMFEISRSTKPPPSREDQGAEPGTKVLGRFLLCENTTACLFLSLRPPPPFPSHFWAGCCLIFDVYRHGRQCLSVVYH